MKLTAKIKSLALCGLLVIPAFSTLSAAESVGLNFSVPDNADTELDASEAAGEVEIEQSHWNNLPGPNGSQDAITDSMGAEIKELRVEWSVPEGDTAWRSRAGMPWGFTGSNLKLQKGYIQLGGSLNVTGVPYAKYDVHVYLNAGENGGDGQVTLSSSSGEADGSKTFYYELTWLDGKFVRAISTEKTAIAKANYVVFSGNTARDFVIEWKGDLRGGWSGVSGVQIVKAP